MRLLNELSRYGLVAHRGDKTHATNKQRWDNLCIHMLACNYGVAILEDRVSDELNPNRALECRFMKGLGREVVPLKERRFKHLRVDLIGAIPKDFEIADNHSVNGASLQEAVGNCSSKSAYRPSFLGRHSQRHRDGERGKRPWTIVLRSTGI
jgi:hypothetical protein